MNARQAQVRMYAVEQHDQEFTVEEFIHWLLKLDDTAAEDIEPVLREELIRARNLAVEHYGQFAKVSADLMLGIGFQQGATFAAAALGRETHAEGQT